MLTCACVHAALRSLGLPTEEEVKLLTQIVKSIPDPRRMPEFMKRRGKQSRALDITDFVKPVSSVEEKVLYHELHLSHTKKGRTDWLGFCRDFNLRVVTTWEQTHTLCNLYVKSERHLQLHEKHIVMQAIQAELSHTTSAINGLPAAVSAVCSATLQLQPPRDDQGLTRGTGKGGATGTRKCKQCHDHAGQTVWYAGHLCLPYLITIGKDPRLYPHTKDEADKMAELPSLEEAHKQLALRKAKSDKEYGPRKAKKRLKAGH